MSKKTIVSLLLIANMYGQMANANEVAISEMRLQNISAAEISALISEGAVRMHDNKALINLDVLNNIFNDEHKLHNLSSNIKPTSARFVPYGNTIERVITNNQLIENLTALFVPYGNT